MVYEYALEPELVTTWGTQSNYRLYIRAFGLGQGRLISRYPIDWFEIVKNLILYGNRKGREKKRLELLLEQFSRNKVVKRTNYCWDNEKKSWIENAIQEHLRYPFFAIMARNNPDLRPEILTEADLAGDNINKWDVPHGRIVPRKALDMTAAIETMLICCRWVKFIDPFIVTNKPNHKLSLKAFLEVLRNDRPVGPPKAIEIHTAHLKEKARPTTILKKEFANIIPSFLSVTLFRWKVRQGGDDLHDRFILTDLGGVSFGHGLDAGSEGKTVNISRLDYKQYEFINSQYDINGTAFELAESPLQIIGTSKIRK